MKDCILALGFFDSVHIGHKKIIEETILLSKKFNAVPAVLLMEGDLNFFTGKTTGLIFTPDERREIFSDSGIKEIVSFKLSKEFLDRSKSEFLKTLKNDYNAKGFVCGNDFTFGKNAEGNVDYLKKYCSDNDLGLSVIDDVTAKGKRVSTRDIKKLFLCGDVENANAELSFPFYYTVKDIFVKNGETALFFDYIKIVLYSGLYDAYFLRDGVKYFIKVSFNGSDHMMTVVSGDVSELKIGDKIFITGKVS